MKAFAFDFLECFRFFSYCCQVIAKRPKKHIVVQQ